MTVCHAVELYLKPATLCAQSSTSMVDLSVTELCLAQYLRTKCQLCAQIRD